MRSRGQCWQWRQEARLEFKKQEEDIEEKKKKLVEEVAQLNHYTDSSLGSGSLYYNINYINIIHNYFDSNNSSGT